MVSGMQPGESLRLPKSIEADSDAARSVHDLVRGAGPLWSGGRLPVARTVLSPALEAALKSAFAAGRVVRGIEDATRVLAAETRGLEQVDRRTGVARGGRVSRLLILADDGAERFYRNAESLLRDHAPRVLALRLSVDQQTLGRLLFGEGQLARLLLIEHKEGVAAVLRAVASTWRDRPPS